MYHLPLGWQPVPISEVDILYSIRVAPTSNRRAQRNYHILYFGGEVVGRALEFSSLMDAFAQHAELVTAFHARDCLFVHAGVVGWRGQALLIPGRSMTGKTTLVKALVESGATYYSDEFAILDKEGLVHPYPRPLSIRDSKGIPDKTPVDLLGGEAGSEPLPPGLVVVTAYQSGAAWNPRRLTPGQALLALMDNTVAARRNPAYTMPVLKQVVTRATALTSKRGKAEEVAPLLLAQLEKSL